MMHGMSQTISPIVQAIKDEMKRKDLNAVGLAALSGLSVSNVYSILDGTGNPTLESLEKLAKAMRLKLIAQ